MLSLFIYFILPIIISIFDIKKNKYFKNKKKNKIILFLFLFIHNISSHYICFMPLEILFKNTTKIKKYCCMFYYLTLIFSWIIFKNNCLITWLTNKYMDIDFNIRHRTIFDILQQQYNKVSIKKKYKHWYVILLLIIIVWFKLNKYI